MSTRKVQHPWQKVGEKDGGGWGQTQPGAPAPNPRSDVDAALRLGIAMGRLVSAVAASYTIYPGGWVGVYGRDIDECIVDGDEKV